MSALIVVDDGTNPPASGSTDLDVSFLATPFTLTNFDDTGVLGWQWTLVDRPAGSGSSLSAPTADTTQITPDIAGSYLFRLQTYTDVGRTILDDQDEQLIGIRFAAPRDWLIPAAGQTTQLGGARGWANQVNELLRESHSGLTTFDLQDAYDNDPAVTVAGGTPIPLTTSGAGEDGLTIGDGADTLRARGNGIFPALNATSDLGTNAATWRRLYVGPGAEATPSVAIDDAGNGFYAPATDQIGVAIAGTSEYTFKAASFDPAADNANSLGSSGLRWSDVWATTTTIGDLNLSSLHDDGLWTINEDRSGLYAHDRRSGKRYKLLMEEVLEAPDPLPLKEEGGA